MKVTLPTKLLVEGIGHSANVAANKSPKPILECVAVRADPQEGVSFEATDLDVGIRYRLRDIAVDQEGSLVVPAGRLLSIIREVDEDETTLEEEDGSLAIDTGRSHFRVRGENIDEFARLPTFPAGSEVVVPGDLLRDLVRRTRFAAATEAGRFALHGVLVVIEGTAIQLVATDGRRLARAAGELPAKAGRDIRVIVGPKGLGLLERVLGAVGGDVHLAVEDRQVLFRCGEALIVSRLIDGTFPSYEDVVPKSSKQEFRTTAADLLSGLRRAALLTTRDALSVELLIDAETVTIRSRATEVGEAKVEIPVTYEGPPARIGFNPVFLQDALKVMDPAAEIRFAFTDAKAPATITDRDEYVYVVMPIALE